MRTAEQFEEQQATRQQPEINHELALKRVEAVNKTCRFFVYFFFFTKVHGVLLFIMSSSVLDQGFYGAKHAVLKYMLLMPESRVDVNSCLRSFSIPLTLQPPC